MVNGDVIKMIIKDNMGFSTGYGDVYKLIIIYRNLTSSVYCDVNNVIIFTTCEPAVDMVMCTI